MINAEEPTPLRCVWRRGETQPKKGRCQRTRWRCKTWDVSTTKQRNWGQADHETSTTSPHTLNWHPERPQSNPRDMPRQTHCLTLNSVLIGRLPGVSRSGSVFCQQVVALLTENKSGGSSGKSFPNTFEKFSEPPPVGGFGKLSDHHQRGLVSALVPRRFWFSSKPQRSRKILPRIRRGPSSTCRHKMLDRTRNPRNIEGDTMNLAISEVLIILLIIALFAALGYALWRIVRSASQK